MNKDYALILMGIGLIVLAGFLGKQCNKTKEAKSKTSYILVDSAKYRQLIAENAKFNAIDDHKSSQILLLSDSIEKLKQGLKATKIVYKEKYIYLKENITDSMCMETLNWANYTITQQDSIITIQSIQIGEYQFQVENLNNQVKFNQDIATKCSKKELDCYVELSKFRHWIFRLYKKRK